MFRYAGAYCAGGRSQTAPEQKMFYSFIFVFSGKAAWYKSHNLIAIGKNG
jgi:hypothetical protein